MIAEKLDLTRLSELVRRVFAQRFEHPVLHAVQALARRYERAPPKLRQVLQEELSD